MSTIAQPESTDGLRRFLFLLSVFWTLVWCYLSWSIQPTVYYPSWKMVSYAAILVGSVAVWLSLPQMRQRVSVILLLFVAIVARLLMSGMPESDDVYRYLWEGRLLLEENAPSPYAAPADQPEYADYQDHNWELMNHKERLTAYPPIALGIFALAVSMDYEIWPMKLLFILFDIGILLLLAKWLSYRGMSLNMLWLFALNPLVLYSTAGEGHYDSAFVFFTLLAVYCADIKRFGGMWLALGAAINIKIMAIVLVPFFFFKVSARTIPWIVPVLVLPALPFYNELPNLLHGIIGFGGESAFNGPIQMPLRELMGGAITPANTVCALLFIMYAGWCYWRMREPVRASLYILGGLIVLSPIVHYWYILWVLPFAVLHRAPMWWVLSATSGLYFFTSLHYEMGFDWGLPSWALWAYWILFVALLLWNARALSRKDKKWPVADRVSVIIPTLNEAPNLQVCLQALQKGTRKPDEIIIADGGSTDDTLTIAESFGCSIVRSEKGRGNQIATAEAWAKNDAIVVVHADAEIAPDCLDRCIQYLNTNREAVGGCMGQRFKQSGLKLFIIEVLNDLRMQGTGTSFGDQVQFYRKSALKNSGGFPDLPLMEDVELSYRLKAVGSVAHLGVPALSSPRAWQGSFFKRIKLVLQLVVSYRLQRYLGPVDTQKLYQRYYSK